MSEQEVYAAWARWLVEGMNAPWDFEPLIKPPQPVLDRMPAIMFEWDNTRREGEILHADVSVADYAVTLADEWGVSVSPVSA